MKKILLSSLILGINSITAETPNKELISRYDYISDNVLFYMVIIVLILLISTWIGKKIRFKNFKIFQKQEYGRDESNKKIKYLD